MGAFDRGKGEGDLAVVALQLRLELFGLARCIRVGTRIDLLADDGVEAGHRRLYQ